MAIDINWAELAGNTPGVRGGSELAGSSIIEPVGAASTADVIDPNSLDDLFNVPGPIPVAEVTVDSLDDLFAGLSSTGQETTFVQSPLQERRRFIPRVSRELKEVTPLLALTVSSGAAVLRLLNAESKGKEVYMFGNSTEMFDLYPGLFLAAAIAVSAAFSAPVLKRCFGRDN